MHCVIKTSRQKAWDDGLAPSVDGKSKYGHPKTQWEGRNCVPAALSFLQQTTFLSESFLPLFYLLLSPKFKYKVCMCIIQLISSLTPNTKQNRGKIHSHENVVCYRKDNPAGTQFLPSPCENDLIWICLPNIWHQVCKMVPKQHGLDQCFVKKTDNFRGLLPPGPL